MSRFRAVFALLATLTLCFSSASADSGSGGPPLYLAQRGSAKVYIFGVGGSSDRAWLTPSIERAVDESQEFWREIPTGEQVSQDFVTKLGTRANGSLFDDLSPTDQTRLLNIGARAGFTGEQLATMKPWYAARILVFAVYAKIGKPIGQTDTPETVMSELARKAGKPVKAEYASWEEFVRFFDRMSTKVQEEYLSYTLDHIDDDTAAEQAGNAAWEKGDVSYFEKSLQDFEKKYPELYGALNGERDAEWAKRIDQFLSNGGTTFILVGVNHTLGTRSIQNELKKRGIRVQLVP